MEKIWKFATDDEYKTNEEYEKNNPKKVLEFYGEALEDDMNGMLKYEIDTSVTSIDSYQIYLKSEFWILVPENKIPRGYSVKVFEVLYTDKLYPCKLHNLLTENRFECYNKEDLTQKIQEEIENKRFMGKIYHLLRHFYSEEEIDNNLKEISGTSEVTPITDIGGTSYDEKIM